MRWADVGKGSFQNKSKGNWWNSLFRAFNLNNRPANAEDSFHKAEGFVEHIESQSMSKMSWYIKLKFSLNCYFSGSDFGGID